MVNVERNGGGKRVGPVVGKVDAQRRSPNQQSDQCTPGSARPERNRRAPLSGAATLGFCRGGRRAGHGRPNPGGQACSGQGTRTIIAANREGRSDQETRERPEHPVSEPDRESEPPGFVHLPMETTAQLRDHETRKRGEREPLAAKPGVGGAEFRFVVVFDPRADNPRRVAEQKSQGHDQKKACRSHRIVRYRRVSAAAALRSGDSAARGRPAGPQRRPGPDAATSRRAACGTNKPPASTANAAGASAAASSSSSGASSAPASGGTPTASSSKPAAPSARSSAGRRDRGGQPALSLRKKVMNMIWKSRNRFQFSRYQRSQLMRSVRSVSPRRPLTCAQPVMPGLALCRAL